MLYQKLQEASPKEDDFQYVTANLPENRHKNRSMKHLPRKQICIIVVCECVNALQLTVLEYTSLVVMILIISVQITLM